MSWFGDTAGNAGTSEESGGSSWWYSNPLNPFTAASSAISAGSYYGQQPAVKYSAPAVAARERVGKAGQLAARGASAALDRFGTEQKSFGSSLSTMGIGLGLVAVVGGVGIYMAYRWANEPPAKGRK